MDGSADCSYAARMPLLDLTDAELRDAAQAARLAAHRAQQDAAAQPNPRISAAFAADAERYTALGERFEAARAKRPPSAS
jgi:hypothetical protein